MAAREVFARRGLDATLDDVAKEAGLGIDTVYRRFKDKSELAEAVLQDDFDGLVAQLEAAAAVNDPWDSFVCFLSVIVERQADNSGMHDLMTSTALAGPLALGIARRVRPIGERVIERAKTAGVLRSDFDGTDVPAIGLMLGTVAAFSRDVRPDLWHRYLVVVLDGLRADRARSAITTSALRPAELRRAMAGWRPHHPGN